jgi:hypothetical protein
MERTQIGVTYPQSAPALGGPVVPNCPAVTANGGTPGGVHRMQFRIGKWVPRDRFERSFSVGDTEW